MSRKATSSAVPTTREQAGGRRGGYFQAGGDWVFKISEGFSPLRGPLGGGWVVKNPG